MNTPESLSSIKTGRLSIDNWINKYYPDFANFLANKYSTSSIKARLYMYYNNIDKEPVCEICGSPVKFYGYTKGFARHCGPSCAQKNPETRSKQDLNCKVKYGDDWRKSAAKQGMVTKQNIYGNTNNNDKRKLTLLTRYNVDNPMKLNDSKEKSKQTCLNKYGVEYNLQRQEIIDANKQRYIANNPEIIDIQENNYICKCTDELCDKCTQKTFTITKDAFYQRKHVYNVELCTVKHPYSSNNNTSIELVIKHILDELGISYIQNDRTHIDRKELDFYVPDKQLGIEVNGLFWHSTESPRFDKNMHIDKYNLCATNNIQLLSIWEDYIINKPQIVKSLICSKLGIYSSRIYARKCIIKEVSSKDATQFIDEYHLQGSINSSVRIGLYYNNELISLMTFGKGRIATRGMYDWELYRYCCKAGVQIIGGASKLFKYFLNTYNPGSVTSFSSNDISNGNLYKQLGFEYVTTSLSYWYINKTTKCRYHRYKFRKSELIKRGYDNSLSESKIMSELNYYRIYDSGQTKWLYKNR